MRNGLVPVHAFGEFNWFCVKKADVTPFPEGINSNLHAKSATKAFQRALFEVVEYLQVLDLPACISNRVQKVRIEFRFLNFLDLMGKKLATMIKRRQGVRLKILRVNREFL